MTSAIRGSCQCGKVSFIVEGGFEQFYLCHCSRCRKDTGSAFGANLFSATSHITWVTGGDHLRTYRLPSTRHARSFCPDCGSALPTTAEGYIVVPAGCLDDDPGISPTAHICFDSRAAWDNGLGSVRKLGGLPDQRD